MADWLEFCGAYLVFIASHAAPRRPALRAALTRVLGERLYLAVYIAVSIAILAWLIVAAGRAPFVALWAYAPWQTWAPNIAMPFVCLLAAFGTAAPNPLSFGGRRTHHYDPANPGIAGVARHPILWAIAIWSGAHLVPNGDLAHVILFGGFGVLALCGMLALDKRLRYQIGDATWSRLAQRTSLVPLGAIVSGRWRPARLQLDLKRLLVAVGLYATFVASHSTLIGVSPLPVF
jgi:uncharacterized membrane protein